MKYIQNTVTIWCILAGLYLIVAGFYFVGGLEVAIGITALLGARGTISGKESAFIYFVLAGLLAFTLYSAGYLVFAIAFIIHSVAMLIIFILEVTLY